MANSEDKFNAVRDMLRGSGTLVAFSGGVDSTVLALLAKEAAAKVVLLTVLSQVVPAADHASAEMVARELSITHRVVTFDWLGQKELSRNREDRCYQCKRALGRLWLTEASKMGLSRVVEGTTASETEGRRPGLRALAELGIESPLLKAGIRKEEVRTFARANGLSVHNRPSMACLATRFPYGTTITAEGLSAVAQMESAAREILGVVCVRARAHGDVARLEIAPQEMERAFDIDRLRALDEAGRKAGFKYVTIDARGYRTGSMDE
ncbi:MAG: ATP-dependent sacrificial sulfur transferase LarE [Candidatus Thorarchaeota archaeon]|nr:ATP-dependent sacrificial sulfur transferase LarE [Candidatus Thorarchaeota archaeon]